MSTSTIKTRLWYLIKESPFTQGEIAEMVGVTQTYLSLVASKKTKPGCFLRRELASLFGVTEEELGI